MQPAAEESERRAQASSRNTHHDPVRLAFRWYGADDPVTLDPIRQIPGVEGVVSALYDVPPGQAWPQKELAALKETIEEAGLHFSTIESIPVHEDIKLGRPERERYIENYATSIERAGALGVEVVCYNFMPVFDWTRTDLAYRLPDGSTALRYDHADEGAAVLFFDEADVLFDPSYAEKAGEEDAALSDYFFDRVEAYPGVAIVCFSSQEYVDRLEGHSADVVVEF